MLNNLQFIVTILIIVIYFNHLIKQQRKIMADLSKLQASVSANASAVQAVATYVGTLSAVDQPAIDAIQSSVDSSTAALNAILPPPAPATPVATA